MGTQINNTFIRYTKPHYSTKLWRSYYHFVSQFYSRSMFEDIITELGMPLDYLLKDGNWVSNDFSIDFMRKLEEKTQDPNIAERVCRFAIAPENINPFEYALIKIMPPTLFYSIFPFEFSKVNKLAKLHVLKRSFGKITYELTPEKENELPEPSVCKGIVGTLHGAGDVYETKSHAIHHSCRHRGDERCLFQLEYNSKPYWRNFFLNKILIALGITGSYFAFGKIFAHSTHSSLIPVLLTVIISMAAMLFFLTKKTYRIIKHSVLNEEHSRQSSHTIFDSRKKLERRYRETTLLSELSHNLISIKDPNEVVRLCLDALEKKFNYQKLFVMLLTDKSKNLHTTEVRGLGEYSNQIASLSLIYPDPRAKQLILTKILENGRTVLISNMNAFQSELTPENKKIVEYLNVNSLIASPIQSQEDKYGLLVIGRTGQEDQLIEEDKELVENVTKLLSLYFINARQYERERSLRVLFQKYVPAAVSEEFEQSSFDAGPNVPREKELCSMFVDLRGFTQVSESINPSKVLDLVNIYAEYVTRIIQHHGGIIDNLIGDGIVAFFPKDDSHQLTPLHNYRQRSLLATLETISNIETLHESFARKGVDFGGLGIGLHAGRAIVGTIGSSQKVNYTAIGDVINLASRLQEYTKIYYDAEKKGHAIALISANAYDAQILEGKTQNLGSIQIRGRKTPVNAYMVTSSLTKRMIDEQRRKVI